jgi:hypothetical protein
MVSGESGRKNPGIHALVERIALPKGVGKQLFTDLAKHLENPWKGAESLW